MIRDRLTRARLVGLVIVVGAFGLGIVAGFLWAARPGPGLVMTVTTTDAIPRELEALGLTDVQRSQIRQALRDGRPLVMSVMDEMQSRMRAALQVTETAIEGVLTPAQVTQWREYRRLNPPRTEQRVIKK